MPVSRIRTSIDVEIEEQEYEVNIFVDNFPNDGNSLNRGFVASLGSLLSRLKSENDAEEWTTVQGATNITFQSVRAENLHTIIDIRAPDIDEDLRLTIFEQALRALREVN